MCDFLLKSIVRLWIVLKYTIIESMLYKLLMLICNQASPIQQKLHTAMIPGTDLPWYKYINMYCKCKLSSWHKLSETVCANIITKLGRYQVLLVYLALNIMIVLQLTHLDKLPNTWSEDWVNLTDKNKFKRLHVYRLCN